MRVVVVCTPVGGRLLCGVGVCTPVGGTLLWGVVECTPVGGRPPQTLFLVLCHYYPYLCEVCGCVRV